MKTFGPLVTKIREEKGMLMQDLADQIETSRAYLSQIERTNSQTMPSREVAEKIIAALQVDRKQAKELRDALEHDLETHQIERVYPSSKLLEDFFASTPLSVQAAADRLKDERGKRRSRQIVQVWKNGLQLPPPQAVASLIALFRNAGIPEARLQQYAEAHLYDAVFHSKDLAHIPPMRRRRIAECAVSIQFDKGVAQK